MAITSRNTWLELRLDFDEPNTETIIKLPNRPIPVTMSEAIMLKFLDLSRKNNDSKCFSKCNLEMFSANMFKCFFHKKNNCCFILFISFIFSFYFKKIKIKLLSIKALELFLFSILLRNNLADFPLIYNWFFYWFFSRKLKK